MEDDVDWYLTVWRRYAEFDGRSRRAEYWMFALYNFLVCIAMGIVGGIGVVLMRHVSWAGGIMIVPLIVYVLAVIVPSLAVTVRRFHDIGKSGWMLLLFAVLGIIPIVNLVTSVIQLVFLCKDSEPGENQYGPNPEFSEPLTIPGFGTLSPE